MPSRTGVSQRKPLSVPAFVATALVLLLPWLLVPALAGSQSAPTPGSAPTVRALLIGIAHYSLALKNQPRGGHARGAGKEGAAQPEDLNGPLNDVEALRSVLVTRFGVDPANITVMTETEATRDHVLQGIRRYLLEPAKAGDFAFLYYSGHGSEEIDPTSDKADHRAQTIMPFASRLPGGRDIRDKELRAALNDLLDKGVHVTAVFDSCYSGSITRGIPRGGVKYRYGPPDLRPQPTPAPLATPTPVDPREPPGKRGAIVLSACLDTQQEPEVKDEKGTPRGLLTLALQESLLSCPKNVSAGDLYRLVRARTAALESYVEPQLDGNPARAFLETAPGTQEGLRLVAVKQTSEGVRFRAGRALGLTEGTRLREVGQLEGKAARELVITNVDGIASCVATPQGQNVPDVQPGTVFEVSAWAAREETLLRLFLPAPFPDQPAIAGMAAIVREAVASWGGAWVDDPTQPLPTHTLSYGDRGWVVETVRGCRRTLGASLAKNALLDALRACPVEVKGGDSAGARALFWDVSPSPELMAGLTNAKALETWAGLGIERSALADANYRLVGRWSVDGPQYAWVRCGLGEKTTGFVLPDRSDWQKGASPKSIGELQKAVASLATISDWLHLAPPPGASGAGFRLRVWEVATGKVLEDGTPLIQGDSKNGPFYGFCIEGGGDMFSQLSTYVLYVGKNGERALVFPPKSDPGQAAKLSLGPERDRGCVKLNQGKKIFFVPEATGPDLYVLLITEQPLDDPWILEGDPVKTKGMVERGGRGLDALSRLVAPRELHLRGPQSTVPTDWSVDRVVYPSVTR
jgi:hypothetical protein